MSDLWQMEGSRRKAPSRVVASAPAKLNLTLEVLGRRPDGYHDLASVLQAITLHDEVDCRPDPEITFRCSQPELAGQDNLVLRAARLLAAEVNPPTGAAITLRKRIPIAAGLGGGSADAAATLLALARLWQLRLSPDFLLSLACQLGSDVPFFLGGATALATGRGEDLHPLPPPVVLNVVIARPAVEAPREDKTRHLYSALTPRDYRDGSSTFAVAEALRASRPIEPTLLVNSFERAADEAFPMLPELRTKMLSAGAAWVRLCGSGPCLYTLVSSDYGHVATRIALNLRKLGVETYREWTLTRPTAIKLAISRPDETEAVDDPG